MTKKLSIIVAIAQNNAIGKDNKLLWHISEDLKKFKEITNNHTIVMGKNTYYSLPIRPLPNRRSVVISDIKDEGIEGCIVVNSINDAINVCEHDRENFIIGGASIYKQFYNIAQKLYITYVYKEFEGDTFFPEIKDTEYKLIEVSKQREIHDLKYEFRIYEKIN